MYPLFCYAISKLETISILSLLCTIEARLLRTGCCLPSPLPPIRNCPFVVTVSASNSKPKPQSNSNSNSTEAAPEKKIPSALGRTCIIFHGHTMMMAMVAMGIMSAATRCINDALLAHQQSLDPLGRPVSVRRDCVVSWPDSQPAGWMASHIARRKWP